MKGTVQLREKIARSKYIHEDELDKLDHIQQEIQQTIQTIIENGGNE